MSTKLSDDQVTYAALDAIKSLEVYFKLLALPDLSLRMTTDTANVGVNVDIVPSHGLVDIMASRAAFATIADQAPWRTPMVATRLLYSQLTRDVLSL